MIAIPQPMARAKRGTSSVLLNMDRSRLLVALLIGALIGTLTGYGPGMDALWPIHAARRLLAGINPYAAPYPELSARDAFTWLYYPLPAVLLCVPVAWLPDRAALGVLMAVSGGLAAWSLFPHAGARWGLASYPHALALIVAQPWPLQACAALYTPALAPLMPAKPSSGLAVLLSRPSWRWLPLAASGVLLLASIPLGWLDHLANHDNLAAITLPASASVLLCVPLLRRSWRARFVLLTACLPLRIYDLTPLAALARTQRGGILVACATWCIPLAYGSLHIPYEVLAPAMLAIAVLTTAMPQTRRHSSAARMPTARY
jgi:hypothetical protein